MSTLLLSVMGAFAEFERAFIRERQLEGITLAKRRGVYKGRKNKLSAADLEQIKEQLNQPSAQKAAIARDWSISRGTLYEYLNGK